jgi:predicted neutral ceramidase superfamily lipid hydrolase
MPISFPGLNPYNSAMSILTTAAIGFYFVAPLIWPPELSIIFNAFFWGASFSFLVSLVLILFLFSNGGSSQMSHFLFSFSLIILSSIMYSGFDLIASNIQHWAPNMKQEYPNLFVYLPQLVGDMKNIVGFGFAAIGASLAANVISNRFNAKHGSKI